MVFIHHRFVIVKVLIMSFMQSQLFFVHYIIHARSLVLSALLLRVI